MKFFALLKKELKECLPFLTGAAVLLLLLGGLFLKEKMQWGYSWYYPKFKSGGSISVYDLERWSHLSDVTSWLFICSVALGLALAIRQFWVAFYSRTWDFEICRSAKRAVILAAKISAALISFIFSVGLVWLLLYIYASQPGLWFVPPTRRVFIEGWILIILGLVTYLGTAAAGLSTARWYTTKLFSLGFVLFVLVSCFCDWRIHLIIGFMVTGILILLIQLIERFLSRQF